MHNTETLSVIPRWKDTIGILSAMSEGAKDILIKLLATMAKFWRSLDETLDELCKRDTELKQGGN
jgi:hypothetical protein